MAGNVCEWCADQYEEKAYKRYREGDLRPPDLRERRVVRGGSWNDDRTGIFRCAGRYDDLPDYRRGDYGFRCVGNAVGSSPGTGGSLSP